MQVKEEISIQYSFPVYPVKTFNKTILHRSARLRVLNTNVVTHLLFSLHPWTFKLQFLQPILYLRDAHKQLPQQAAPVVFNHHNLRSLVDG